MKNIFFISLLFLSSFAYASGFEIIPDIIDGDSLTLKTRLHGIDAPEHDQEYGEMSKKALKEVVKDKKIICYKKAYDTYGRTVAECFAGDVNINAYMVLNGHAWAYRKYGDDYNKLEDIAKKEKRGLWAAPSPIAPWDFRKEKRKQRSSQEGF